MTATHESALHHARQVALPCPFCGSERGFETGEGSTFRWQFVECLECGGGPGEIRKDADALAAWNTRAAVRAIAEGWVSVEDRLPDEGVPVWLCENGHIYIGQRDDCDDGWLWGKCYSVPTTKYKAPDQWDAEAEQDDDYQPTLWHPLPPLPAAPTGAKP